MLESLCYQHFPCAFPVAKYSNVLTFEIISKVSATVIFCVDNFSEIIATVNRPWLFSVVKYSHEVTVDSISIVSAMIFVFRTLSQMSSL